MKFIASIVLALSLGWLSLLVTNGAILTTEEQVNNGLSLKCQYITASGLVSVEYLNVSHQEKRRLFCARWKEKNAYPR